LTSTKLVGRRLAFLDNQRFNHTMAASRDGLAGYGSRRYSTRCSSRRNRSGTNAGKDFLVATRSAFTVARLTAGTKYWFRVAAVGAAGQGPWSDQAMKMAP